ncbi:VOC family protein [Marinigracilibium pacificum]|uniref:Glyoxalase n=1 Tax=Marinigracilibium pacificum TaxID=2729599 RepID=A0A848IVT0_9BACT|nr:glyoxalase [Marinigracilibium pacificum]NMM47796.1 glyoxalase [Marinigracilibium pacificum]
MLPAPVSIRPFIGAKDYSISRKFYKDLGFSEVKLFEKMSYFHIGNFGFYLQDYFNEDWVGNTMVFYEVSDIEKVYQEIKNLDLLTNYPEAKIKPISYNDWGNEFFIHDPSNILWHIGEFNKE